jgi:hypothetical protein
MKIQLKPLLSYVPGPGFNPSRNHGVARARRYPPVYKPVGGSTKRGGRTLGRTRIFHQERRHADH